MSYVLGVWKLEGAKGHVLRGGLADGHAWLWGARKAHGVLEKVVDGLIVRGVILRGDGRDGQGENKVLHHREAETFLQQQPCDD